MGERETEGSPAPGQLSQRPEPSVSNSSCLPVCPPLSSKAHAPSATSGILEQKETGSSHRPSSSGFYGSSLKLSKTSLVVKMWEEQAQNFRARAGKVMTEQAGTLLETRFWEEKNGEVECNTAEKLRVRLPGSKSSLSCWVTLEKQPILSVPQFPPLKNGGESKVDFTGSCSPQGAPHLLL